MKLKTIYDVDLKEKTILYRAPYDIGVREVNGVFELEDDMRIEATIPTLEYLLKQGCKIVVLTYVKRPDGQVVEKLRTTPHAKRLSDLLHHPVLKVDDCIGKEVETQISQMKIGDIIMLENVRFHNEEMIDDDEFAKKLCIGKDLIVFDGFPQAHRMHSSTTGIERHLPTVAGLYLEHEVNMLSQLIENPKRPFTVIIGGAKVSDKVDAINNLFGMVDTIITGGGVANVFLKAKGVEMGDSFIEDVFVDKVKKEKKDWVVYAKEIMESASKNGKEILCPKDVVITDGVSTRIIEVETEGVPEGWMAFDIGPKAQKEFSEKIKQSHTVFLNGPMGKFEEGEFTEGTQSIIDAMADLEGQTIIAGGDTIDFARTYGDLKNYSHISLAGGATLEFLAGKELPALKAMELK